MEEPEEDVYCVCRGPYSKHRFMIECYSCKEWFHGDCVGVSEGDADNIEDYYCSQCQVHHGPPKLKGERVSHVPAGFEGRLKHATVRNFYESLDTGRFLNSNHVVHYLTCGGISCA